MDYLFSEHVHILGQEISEGPGRAQALAYLLTGEQPVLVDLLPGGAELVGALEAVLPPAALKALVLNRWEAGLAGALEALLAAAPGLTVYCTPACKAELEGAVPRAACRAVASGERLRLGEYEFHFTHTPDLPRPGSMVTYCENLRVLFSGDLFGQYIAAEPPLDDQCPPQKLIALAADYFDAVFSAAPPERRRAVFDLADPELEWAAPSRGLVLQDALDDVFGYYELVCRQG